MGAVAQLRQFFLDAGHHRELQTRRGMGKPGLRPAFDADFDAIEPTLMRKHRLLCEADGVGDVERWIRLSDEFRFDIGITGGRSAWKRADVLKKRSIPVFLTLEWGEEVEDPHAKDKEKPTEAKPAAEKAEEKPEEKAAEAKPDWKFQEPMRVREEKRRLWEETRDNAIRLAEAGVVFAFGTGKGAPKDLLEHVRTLVEKGLPSDAALRALTVDSATLLGVGKEYGKVEPGFAASIALWTQDPLASKDAKVAWFFAEGFPTEFDVDQPEALTGKPDAGVDATGTWTFEFDSPRARPATAELSMEKEGDVKGTFRFRGGQDETERSSEFTGHVAGKKIRLTGKARFANFEADVVVDGEIEKDEIRGTALFRFPNREDSRPYKATRKPNKEDSR